MNMNIDKKSLMKIITQASFALDDTIIFRYPSQLPGGYPVL